MRWVFLAVLALSFGAAIAAEYPTVAPGRAIIFPADHGAHPQFRTEWWYITGWLDSDTGPLGFQITFFRTRPETNDDNPSAFAPKQVLLAHAALSDPKIGHLLHDQRAARAGFGLAEAATADTDVVLDSWTLKRSTNGKFHAAIGAKDFTLDLTFAQSQAPLLEGENGYSRKGPDPKEASYYYSLPQLSISGTVMRGNSVMAVKGSAWFDHEWSTSYLNPGAVGWDWTGLNFDDGSSLMAFTIRDGAGSALWSGGTFRQADGTSTRLGPRDVAFSSARRWRSPRTGAEYPVEPALTLKLPAGEGRWLLNPLFDDQELDSRAAGGPVYWEGAVATTGGRGYLELTGYFRPLKM
jgi:predicted secreted hydrolase